MKVLFMIPYFHSDKFSPYRKFKAGLAYTIESIISYFATSHQTYVFAQSAFCKGYVEDNLHIMPKRLFDIIPLPLVYLKELYRDLRGQRITLKYFIHAASYYLYGGYAERLIKKVKPDIVSVRSIGYITKPLIMACERTNTKYVVSLHGLIYYLPDKSYPPVTTREKQMEKELFITSINRGNIVTVISSGIKYRMLKELSVDECDSIKVVNNGIDYHYDVNVKSKTDTLRDNYSITRCDRVVICAASLIERKNQAQIIRAFCLLPEKTRSTTKLLLLGIGDQYDSLSKMINESNMNAQIFLCGHVPNSEMTPYYALANINVIASTDEGFGRAFVEGFLNGVPAVTFDDLDAVNDLYDQHAMILANERSDLALAKALNQALSKDWNRHEIIEHGKKFSTETMCTKYESLYTQVIESSSSEQ